MGQKQMNARVCGGAYTAGRYLHSALSSMEERPKRNHSHEQCKADVCACLSHNDLDLDYDSDSDSDSEDEEGNGRGQPRKLPCGCHSNHSSFPTEAELTQCRKDWGDKDAVLPQFCHQSNTFQIPSIPGVEYYIQSKVDFIDLIDRLENFKLLFDHGPYDLLYIVAGIFRNWQSLAVFMSPRFSQFHAQRFHKLMGLKKVQRLTQSDRIATISLIFKVNFHDQLPENANTCQRPAYVYGNGNEERYLPQRHQEQNSAFFAEMFGQLLTLGRSR